MHSTIRKINNEIKEYDSLIGCFNSLNYDFMNVETLKRLTIYANKYNRYELVNIINKYAEYIRNKDYLNNMHYNNNNIISKMIYIYTMVNTAIEDIYKIKIDTHVNEGNIQYKYIRKAYYDQLATIINYLSLLHNDPVFFNMKNNNKLLLGINFSNIFLNYITFVDDEEIITRTLYPNYVRKALSNNPTDTTFQLYKISSPERFTHYRLESNYKIRYIAKENLILYDITSNINMDTGLYYNIYQDDPSITSIPTINLQLVSSIPVDALVEPYKLIEIGKWYISPDTVNYEADDYDVSRLLVDQLNNNAILDIDTTKSNFTLNFASILPNINNTFNCKLMYNINFEIFPLNKTTKYLNFFDNYLKLINYSKLDINNKIVSLTNQLQYYNNLGDEIKLKNEEYINNFKISIENEVCNIITFRNKCNDTIELLCKSCKH